MPQKERRIGSEEQSRCNRNRWLLATAILLTLVGILILSAVVVLYTRSLNSNDDYGDTDEYLRKLVRQINDNSSSTWTAVAAAGVASDRACIHTNGTFRASFSEEDILGCCEVCGNCYGGDPLKALAYWVKQGLVTGGRDGCRPYSFDISCGVPCSPQTFFDAEKSRTCIRRCQNIYYQNRYEDDKHFASLAYSVYPRGMTISDSNAEKMERAKVPTIVGHFNATANPPLTLEQVREVRSQDLVLIHLLVA
ncbi:papain family cysteine protease [Oesophagostomum dentatum]|uniref:Papain family cysteine protease n=1 Tax=Oesophagostomum dentatum TaxID=61180 RepID=A0A0B1SS65_OESDE|nr:papain family cysteine protease [Oesophagostomum dentatum]